MRRRRSSDDFAAEIEAHVALEIDRLQREEGLDYAAARTRALRAFGSVTGARERFYESGRWLWWDHLGADVAYGVRMLRKTPGFTGAALLTTALAVGATTAIFGLVDATLLHPLPYPHPDDLVSIHADLPGIGARDVGLSYPEWQDLQRTGLFDYISPFWFDENNLTGGSQPIRVNQASVAPNYFALLGIPAQRGSTFDPRDPSPGYNLQVVISDGLWKRAFGSDPHIIGKTIRDDTDAYRVVGVMPPGFRPPGRTTGERSVEIWMAAGFHATPFADPAGRNNRVPGMIARLKPGVTIEDAGRRVEALAATLRTEFPEDYPAQSAWTMRVAPLRQMVVGDAQRALLLLLGAVTLVLLIACVNIANLQLARSSARRREMAIRQALGAARSRLVRQLLTETVLLSLAGGAAGLVLLAVAQPFLLRLVPDSLPRLVDISINPTMLVFALGASLAAGTIFGLAPALHARRVAVTEALNEQGRGSSGSREQARTRRLLVVTEFALSLVLMVAASLLLRSFWQLLHVDLGFTPARVMTVRTRLPYPNNPKLYAYGTPAKQSQFVREILRRVRTLPGVEQAAVTNMTAVPLDHDLRDANIAPLVLEGRPASAQVPNVITSVVTPEYFNLIGLTLLRGRWLDDFDKEDTADVVLVNDTMARTYWPGVDPLGKRLKLSKTAAAWATVVGIVADARSEALETAHVPEVFASLYQRRDHHLAVVLRGQLDQAAILGGVREQVQAIDPSLPVFGGRLLDDVVAGSLESRRFSLVIVGLFALTALALAALGIYGVLSFLVGERTREIGIRLALGARREAIVRSVLGEGLRLAIAGTIVGLAGAIVVARAMARVLYGVRPFDPTTFAGVALLLVAVAAIACYRPARRAVDVDPVHALRLE